MTKEQIHDDRINPLVAQIVEICRESGIGMVASFHLDGDMRCSTHLPDGDGAYPFKDVYRVLMHGRGPPPLMLTTRDADGNVKSMTAIVG